MKANRPGPSRLKLPSNFLGTVNALPNTPPPPKGPPPTYRAIAAAVRKADGFSVKTCWIADVLRQLGYPVKDAPNRKGREPVNPCPAARVAAIRRAVRHLTGKRGR